MKKHRKIKPINPFGDSDEVNFILTKPGRASLLPQYLNSGTMYERFLEATLSETNEIDRAPNVKGPKLTEDYELDFDSLGFFVMNKKKLEKEFLHLLSERITNERAVLFCEIVSQYWFDGYSKRNDLRVRKLFASIKHYIENKKLRVGKSIYVKRGAVRVTPSFSDSEIESIIELNREMLDGYIPQWLGEHPNSQDISSGDVYCRRGLFLKQRLKKGEYKEQNYINSYSLAFTLTEKFAKMYTRKPGKRPIHAIVNTHFSNLRNRTLFFSPFIKDMPPDQFELGIIPDWRKMVIKRQGKFGGIEEYLLD